MTFFHLDCQRESEKRWSDFNTGTRCKYCSIERVGIEQRWKIEDCKKIAKDGGFKLIDNEYVNGHKQMKFIHIVCGFDFEVSWSDFDFGCGY